jgi:hypothetical protein
MKQTGISRTVTSLNRITFLFIRLTTVISLLTLAFWVLGVPGVQNQYAIGWALGLKTLYHYFIGCCLLLIIYTVVSRIAKRNMAVLRFNILVVSAFWIFFIYSVFNLYQAFVIMFSAS